MYANARCACLEAFDQAFRAVNRILPQAVDVYELRPQNFSLTASVGDIVDLDLRRLGWDESARVLAYGRQARLHCLTPKFSAMGKRGVVVVSVVRNERKRIAEFIRHYRRGGVAFFSIVDNGSTDGTIEYLRAQRDVCLFATDESFDVERKQGWISRLIEYHGRERWYISADADEHMVFDGYSDRGFDDAVEHFEAAGLTRVRARMIDMYSSAPVLGSARPPETPLAESMPYFDPDGYQEWNNHQIPSCTGGPRKRVLAKLSADFSPQLTKFPLFRLRKDEVFANPHYIWPYIDNFGTGVPLALLHYKFDEEPLARIRDAIDRNAYWNQSAEYRLYLEALKANPLLSFYYEGSRRYSTPRDLVDSGLLDPLPAYFVQGTSRCGMVAAASRAKAARLAARTVP